MDNYSNADYVEMLILYGECQRNARLTCRVYRERFPDRQRFPTHGLITRLVNRARESGYVGLNHIERVGRPRDQIREFSVFSVVKRHHLEQLKIQDLFYV
ncbi:hypothetical protein KQX54_000246 [Cotesia glomerata]|uniref:DUF4817 domain-containing protein n=1 Tax=Cotesia glomerata TaxID=32391 RepID=A0AAV7I8A2_COTGL|nr:hypothetical protein KQX54_000246 [Cotesia glomerata]